MHTYLGVFYQVRVPPRSSQKPISKSHYTAPLPPNRRHKLKHLPLKPISEKTQISFSTAHYRRCRLLMLRPPTAQECGAGPWLTNMIAGMSGEWGWGLNGLVLGIIPSARLERFNFLPAFYLTVSMQACYSKMPPDTLRGKESGWEALFCI